MRFNKILTLCKKKQRVHLITDNENNVQYLSDTAAMYPLYGLPKMNIENIQNLMGLSDKQRDCWIFTESDTIENVFSDDTFVGEEHLEPLPVSIDVAGSKLLTYTSSLGLIMIQKQYLEALSCAGDVELYLRIYGKDGIKYVIVAKSGLVNYGAIMPEIPDEATRATFNTLTSHFSLMCENFKLE